MICKMAQYVNRQDFMEYDNVKNSLAFHMWMHGMNPYTGKIMNVDGRKYYEIGKSCGWTRIRYIEASAIAIEDREAYLANAEMLQEEPDLKKRVMLWLNEVSYTDKNDEEREHY